jgi:hypothetical protein
MSTTALGAGTGSPQTEGNGQGGGPADLLKNVDPQRLARGLGWFSIGLGLAEVLTTRG